MQTGGVISKGNRDGHPAHHSTSTITTTKRKQSTFPWFMRPSKDAETGWRHAWVLQGPGGCAVVFLNKDAEERSDALQCTQNLYLFSLAGLQLSYTVS